ncbi:MAG: class I SAM-dependent methyltransferase [Candidatus Helarchaeota archaeon]
MNWKKWRKKLKTFDEKRVRRRIKGVDCLTKRYWTYSIELFQKQLSTIHGSGIILDIGCGSGENLSRIVKEKEYRGIGLDPLPESSLKSFKKNIKKYGLSQKLDLIKGIGEYLPLKKDYVQLCIMTATLDHVNDPIQVIKEIHRVLNHNGIFFLLQTIKNKKILSDDETHLHQFTLNGLKQLISEFKIEKINKIYGIPKQLLLFDRLLIFPIIFKLIIQLMGMIDWIFQRFYNGVIIKAYAIKKKGS